MATAQGHRGARLNPVDSHSHYPTNSQRDNKAMPNPPYYAVIFVSRRTPGDHGYSAMAEHMEELARGMQGFLGIDSARGTDGLGITVSYWADEAAIAAWRQHAEHQIAQERGRRDWYESYQLHIARVERAYSSVKAASAHQAPAL